MILDLYEVEYHLDQVKALGIRPKTSKLYIRDKIREKIKKLIFFIFFPVRFSLISYFKS